MTPTPAKRRGRPKGSKGNRLVRMQQDQVIEGFLKAGHSVAQAAQLSSRQLGHPVTERKVKTIKDELEESTAKLIQRDKETHARDWLHRLIQFRQFLLKEYDESDKPLKEIQIKHAQLSTELIAGLEQLHFSVKTAALGGNTPIGETSAIAQKSLFNTKDHSFSEATISFREQKKNVALLAEIGKVDDKIAAMLGVTGMALNGEAGDIKAIKVIYDFSATENE